MFTLQGLTSILYLLLQLKILISMSSWTQPGSTVKHTKEGTESSSFWFALGGKQSYTSKKVSSESIRDPHLFSFSFNKGSNYFSCYHLTTLHSHEVSSVLLKSWILVILAWPNFLSFDAHAATCSPGKFEVYIVWDLVLSSLLLFMHYKQVFLNNIHVPGGRNIQLLSRWPLDWGCIDTWYTCWSVCLGWSICGLQRETKCFWDWTGIEHRFSTANVVFPSVSIDWLSLSQKYVDMAASLEGLPPYVPLYKVTEGNEPCFFTTYFSWDPAKASVCHYTCQFLEC